ncbi:hypothetical protein J2M53_16750, partial [Arthrobacter sp. zg-ZUI100]|uniref:hypothetical protein n=1 Tax=Arthrobacter jiangjiafuii TaxID=2817475 RepID=UPI001AEEF5DB
ILGENNYLFFFSLRCSVSLFYSIRTVFGNSGYSRSLLHFVRLIPRKIPGFPLPGREAQGGSPGCFWWGLAAMLSGVSQLPAAAT